MPTAISNHLQHRQTYTHYATVQRIQDTLPLFGTALQPMVRELYADPQTVAVMQANSNANLPNDAQFVMETYLAQVDPKGVPVSDTNNQWIKADLVAIESNTKHIRANDTGTNWQPNFRDPQSGDSVSVNFAECTACHRAAEGGSVYSLGALRMWLRTGQVQLLRCNKPNRMPCV